jgi:uncharacterized phage protein gp47/JayE
MAIAAPTTSDLRDNIVAQISASLSQRIPLLPKAFTYVLATVLAGMFIILRKYSEFIFLQIFIAHATLNETVIAGQTVRPLVLWGELIGAGDPEDATRAEMTVNVTVLVQTGALPGGAQLLCAATGVLYQTTAAIPLNAAVVTPTIRAMSDQTGGDGSGSIGNLNPGDVVSFANPLPNVVKDAVVIAQTVVGVDGETEAAYRSRIFQRFQAVPKGGALAHYREWALSVDGIVGAYPYASPNAGEVDVYVEATEASSGSPDGIPTLAQLSAVLGAINAVDGSGVATARPVNAAINVLPITRTALDVYVTNLIVSSTDFSDVTAAINEGVDEYLRSREPFIEGLSSLPRDDGISVPALGGIIDGIVSGFGGTATSVLLKSAGVSIPFYLLGTGEKAKLNGTVHFIA